ncbi:MAG: acyl carrier protein [Bacteroidetes bacterium]|nr:MAG: acyl carrier protein [Bacteroidota bacterium]
MIAIGSAEKIKSIVAAKLGLEENNIRPDTTFHKDLGIDSLDLVEVIWEVEKKFKVTIPDEELERLHTIGDLADFVDQRI